ncbi:hypothetical protein BGX26_009417 [Mortierella sp. AD094]|nr:hypothetical protein BGX26_009417 [Mortierella sp. AD094]
MTQLLESTRNYFKSSTRLGRRMSGSPDETSGSETSLHSGTHGNNFPISKDGSSHRSSPKKRLSGVFTPEGRKSPTPNERPITYDDATLSYQQHRDTKNDERALKNSKSLRSTKSRGKDASNNLDRDCASEHMEEEVPRGRSPTLSMSNTFSTAASSYDMRPTDYPNIRQYQAHVWRRNLLEESIMHSLRLGYGDRRRPSSRHQPRSSRKDSLRSRKTREMAILTVAMGKDLPPFPTLDAEVDTTATQENIIDRSLKIIENRPEQQQPQQFRREKNSPYQLDYNTSMTNITQSFASFTLELPDHQATHVMALSAIPDLFKIKAIIPGVYRPRSRRNSRSSVNSGITPSPRVLTGKKPVVPLPQLTLPDVIEDEDPESPLTPTSVAWADSVFESLDKVSGTKKDAMVESRLKALEVAPARAV